MAVLYNLNGGIATITLEGWNQASAVYKDLRFKLNSCLAEFDHTPEALVAELRIIYDQFEEDEDRGYRDEGTLPDIRGVADRPSQAESSVSASSAVDAQSEGIYRSGKPVIAAILGDCLDEVLIVVGHATDVRIAGQRTTFGFLGAQSLGAAAMRSQLHQQIPRTALMWMLLTGEKLHATEALRVGLVTEVVPEREVLSRAHTIACQIAELSPMTVRAEKETLIVSQKLTMSESLRHLIAVDIMSHRQPDAEEGVKAWIEGRRPQFWRFEEGKG